MRRNMTVAEEILWDQVRDNELGFHIRRQQQCGDFILDFYCAKARVAFEIDGPLHDPEKDRERDKAVEERGILTIRFKEEDVRLDIGWVLREIVEHCERRSGKRGNPKFSSWQELERKFKTPTPAPPPTLSSYTERESQHEQA
jgi:very-short-patch-repair endonuclease